MRLIHPVAIIGLILNMFFALRALSLMDGKPLVPILLFASFAVSCLGLALLYTGKSKGRIPGIAGCILFMPVGIVAIAGFFLTRTQPSTPEASESTLGTDGARQSDAMAQADLQHKALQRLQQPDASSVDAQESSADAETTPAPVLCYPFQDTRMRAALLTTLAVALAAVLSAKFHWNSGRIMLWTVGAGGLYMLGQRRFKHLNALELHDTYLCVVPTRKLWEKPHTIAYADILRAGQRGGKSGYIMYRAPDSSQRTLPIPLHEVAPHLRLEAQTRFAGKMRMLGVPYQQDESAKAPMP